MGTTIFEDSRDPIDVLRDELRPHRVVKHTATAGGVTFAMEIDITDDTRDDLLAIYDLPEDATCVVMGGVIKGSGWNLSGPRTVECKVMTEDMGPYIAPGVTRDLLASLSPLRIMTTRTEYASGWRERAAKQAV